MRQIVNGFLALSALLAAAPVVSAQLLRPKCTPVAPSNYCPPVDPYLTPPNVLPNPTVPTPMVDPNNPNPAPPQPGQNDPLQNAFAQGNEGGGTSARTFNDNFNGDFGGIFVTRQVQVGQLATTIITTGSGATTTTTITPIYRNVVVPLGSRYNGILITDNDSPRPTDRVFFGYNYYNGISPAANTGLDRIDQHRQTTGFETTFLGGNASWGMRLPFVQINAPLGLGQSNVGDLTLFLKYAFYNNANTGDVASFGMLVSTPTGGGNNYVLADGSTPPNDVLLQPWLGGVRMFGRGYAQGITSMVIPTDGRDPLLFNNSVGLGFFLYQNAADRFVNALVPYMETHVRTPLNHRNTDAPLFFQDQLNLTFGMHFRTARATVSPGFNVPLISPQAYNGEFNLMFNLRF